MPSVVARVDRPVWCLANDAEADAADDVPFAAGDDASDVARVDAALRAESRAETTTDDDDDGHDVDDVADGDADGGDCGDAAPGLRLTAALSSHGNSLRRRPRMT